MQFLRLKDLFLSGVNVMNDNQVCGMQEIMLPKSLTTQKNVLRKRNDMPEIMFLRWTNKNSPVIIKILNEIHV